MADNDESGQTQDEIDAAKKKADEEAGGDKGEQKPDPAGD